MNKSANNLVQTKESKSVIKLVIYCCKFVFRILQFCIKMCGNRVLGIISYVVGVLGFGPLHKNIDKYKSR